MSRRHMGGLGGVGELAGWWSDRGWRRLLVGVALVGATLGVGGCGLPWTSELTDEALKLEGEIDRLQKKIAEIDHLEDEIHRLAQEIERQRATLRQLFAENPGMRERLRALPEFSWVPETGP